MRFALNGTSSRSPAGPVWLALAEWGRGEFQRGAGQARGT